MVDDKTIMWYSGILQGLARGCKHFGEGNTMCVPEDRNFT